MIKRHLVLRATAYFLAAALCFASIRWPQAAGVATVLLLLVTFEYVVLTRTNLELFRHQVDRQEKVHLHFDVVCRNGPLYLRVANLGISNFLVTGIHVQNQDTVAFDYRVHQIVESGKSEEIALPREVCAGHPLSVDLEMTVEYVGLDVHGVTAPKCFNISMMLDNIPDRATEGLDGLWPVTCPNCNLGGMLFVSIRGLSTFAEARARKRRVQADLQDSCPAHRSEWLMGMEEARR